jgi:hypothetical protein
MDLSSIAVGGMTSFSEAATSFKGLFKTEAPEVTTIFMKKRATTKGCIPDHILTIRTLSMEFIELILASSDRMRDLVRSTGGDDSLKHKVLASVFYEPSTRTSCSFQAAMLRLGGTVVCVNGADSSVKKGESLEDTVQTMQCYCDIIALRHPDKGSAEAASIVAYKPIINAGESIVLSWPGRPVDQRCRRDLTLTLTLLIQGTGRESTPRRPCWTCTRSSRSWAGSRASRRAWR